MDKETQADRGGMEGNVVVLGDSSERGVSRRGLLAGALAGSAALGLSGLLGAKSAAAACPPATSNFRIGINVSPGADESLDSDVVYRDGVLRANSLLELQLLLMTAGGNEVWHRVGTSRLSQYPVKQYTIGQFLSRARLARDVNRPFNPELTLCGYYGDIAIQPPPDFTGYPTSGPDALQLPAGTTWDQLTITQMADLMRTYGRLAAREVLDTGCRVNVWDIGNEVELGVAGLSMQLLTPYPEYRPPDAVNPAIGQMSYFQLISLPDPIGWLQNELWPYVAAILQAVAEGIRQVDPNAKVATHSSTIAPMTVGWLKAFHQSMAAGGFDAVHLGTSWYPGSTNLVPNRYELFKSEVAATKQALGKPIYVAEYAYPAGPTEVGGQSWSNPLEQYPVSEAGQTALLRDMTNWGLRNATLAGIRPYGVDDLASGWVNNSFFRPPVNNEAVARPVLRAVQQGIALACA